MSALSAAQRIRVDELLDVLLDTPIESRAGYLDRNGRDDPAVRDEVESLVTVGVSAPHARGGT